MCFLNEASNFSSHHHYLFVSIMFEFQHLIVCIHDETALTDNGTVVIRFGGTIPCSAIPGRCGLEQDTLPRIAPCGCVYGVLMCCKSLGIKESAKGNLMSNYPPRSPISFYQTCIY